MKTSKDFPIGCYVKIWLGLYDLEFEVIGHRDDFVVRLKNYGLIHVNHLTVTKPPKAPKPLLRII